MYADPMTPRKAESGKVDPRTEAAAVREYLELLGAARKPRGRRTKGYMQRRLAEIRELLAGDVKVLDRVKLIQERIDLETDLAALEDTSRIEAAQKGFVTHAKSWAERNKISYQALREAGVPPAVLREAGINP